MKPGDSIRTVRAEDGSLVDIRIPNPDVSVEPIAPAAPVAKRVRQTERQAWLASIDKWLSTRRIAAE